MGVPPSRPPQMFPNPAEATPTAGWCHSHIHSESVLNPESCWRQQETQTCQTKELVIAKRAQQAEPHQEGSFLPSRAWRAAEGEGTAQILPHPIDPPEQAAQLSPAWLQGSERAYCSPSPPQSKQQKQSRLPQATPLRDAANKQKSKLISQMLLQEQGEGRRYPSNPPPPFISPQGMQQSRAHPANPLHCTCQPLLQNAPALGGLQLSQHPPPLQLSSCLPEQGGLASLDATGQSLSRGKGRSPRGALHLSQPCLKSP